ARRADAKGEVGVATFSWDTGRRGASRIAPVRTKRRGPGSVVAGHTVVFGLSRTWPVHEGMVNTQVRARSRTSRTSGQSNRGGRGARVWPTIHIRTPSRVYGCGCTGWG